MIGMELQSAALVGANGPLMGPLSSPRLESMTHDQYRHHRREHPAGRHGRAVADGVFDLAAQRKDAKFEVVDLAGVDLPHLDEQLPASAGQYAGVHTRRWAATIDRFDGFLFVTPEYNHSVPGVLKDAIDFLYAEWNDKAAGFVSYGVQQGVRAVEHL